MYEFKNLIEFIRYFMKYTIFKKVVCPETQLMLGLRACESNCRDESRQSTI